MSTSVPNDNQVESPLRLSSDYIYTIPNNPELIKGYLQKLSASWGMIRLEDIIFLNEAQQEREKVITNLFLPWSSETSTISPVDGNDKVTFNKLESNWVFPPLGYVTDEDSMHGVIWVGGYNASLAAPTKCHTSSWTPDDFHLYADTAAAMSCLGYTQFKPCDWVFPTITGYIGYLSTLTNVYKQIATPFYAWTKINYSEYFGVTVKWNETSIDTVDGVTTSTPGGNTSTSTMRLEKFSQFFQLYTRVERQRKNEYEGSAGGGWTLTASYLDEHVKVSEYQYSSTDKIRVCIGSEEILSSIIETCECAVPVLIENKVMRANVDEVTYQKWVLKSEVTLSSENGKMYAELADSVQSIYNKAIEVSEITFYNPDEVRQMCGEIPAPEEPSDPPTVEEDWCRIWGQEITSRQEVNIYIQSPAFLYKVKPRTTHPELTSYCFGDE